MPQRIAVKLKPAAERIIKQGHPWVFSDSIIKLKPKGETGDLTILFDQTDNKVFAVGLYDADSPMRIKIIHRGGPAKINAEFFQHKIELAHKKRNPLFNYKITAYRMLFGENDGFPGLIVDVYHKTGVLKLYSKIWLPYLKDLVNHIVDIAGLNSLMLRLSRKLQNEDNGLNEGKLLFGTLEDSIVQFEEYGVQFQADVQHGHKTGFFLDHRENRRQIGEKAADQTVLDVFAYAGGFSVHALVGSAKEVTSLDISRQALDLAVKNAQLNQHSGRHKIIVGDAFEELKVLVDKNITYGIVVIDPPSLAKSTKERSIAQKKYGELAKLGAQLTEHEGLLLLASCSSRISKEEFLNIHQKMFKQNGVDYTLEKTTEHDVDHPVGFQEGAYLKSAYYRIH